MSQARVVVIGGGATGTGILRDLAMRGIQALLVEKADLASGTSSRFHGLLHSGARYAVNDPEAARECIAENRILRRIGASCVEETEGYFVRTPHDDPAFEERWLCACRDAGIDVAPVPLAEALLREPNLTKDALAVYRVPDAAVDGFRLVWHNVMAARRHGGAVRTYSLVTGIETANGAVTGVRLFHASTGSEEIVPCDFVINAAGSWAGEVAALAGLSVPVTPDRGTLLAFNHRFTSRVVNRLRPPSDGDIFVPHGSITIYGTTSAPADGPGDTTPTSREVMDLVGMGEPLFPHIRDYRILRAFAGTRPLYTPNAASGRGATRNFVIIDHAADGLANMVSVTGGKFTSYRLMAEKTVDLVAARLGVTTPCRTAAERITPLPDAALMERAKTLLPSGGMQLAVARLGDDLGHAVTAAENNPWKKLLLCECELVTLAEFETVAAEPTSHTLGDIRRRTRLGMGTCQGSFCALRATGALVESGHMPKTPPRDLFRHFLQERWGGIRPLLWGAQLREIELERGIYGATLNIDAEGYDPAAAFPAHCPPLAPKEHAPARPPVPAPGHADSDGGYDVIVAGAGFAGLTAAAAAAERGLRVLVIARGAGALTIGGGTVDLFGGTAEGPVRGNPFAAMRALPPTHPYSLVGEERIRDALDFLAQVFTSQGLPLVQAGSETTGNAWMPTAAGTMKPTWITGPTMNPAALHGARSVAVVGVTGMKDFSPQLAETGLRQTPWFSGMRLGHHLLPSPFAAGSSPVRDTTALDLAAYVTTPAGFDWLANALARLDTPADALLVPAILGTLPSGDIHARLERACGKRLVELFCPPPSVTGLRMQHALTRHLRAKQVRFVENATIVGAVTATGRCRALVARSGNGAERHYAAPSFVIATGGIFSEGLATAPGTAREAIFGLPLVVPAVQEEWSQPDFFGRSCHPFATFGVAVDSRLTPLSPKGGPLFGNVHFAGRILGGYDYAAEKSGSGVALTTGYHAGTLAADEAAAHLEPS